MRTLTTMMLAMTLSACGTGTEPISPSSGAEPEAWSYRLTVSDALALPGQTARLAAKVESADPFRVDIDDVRVDFWIGNEHVGHGITDDDGTAYISAVAPVAIGAHTVTASYDRWSGRGRAHVQAASTRFFVTDIDKTISDIAEVLVPVTPNSAIPAMAGSVAALKEFDQDRDVIYLTARDDYLLDKTRDWLKLRGFPTGAVFVNDWMIGGPSQGDYKERLLRELKADFPNIEAGAGENLHDAEAYMANDMRAYLIGQELDGATTVSGWSQIRALEL
jgi:hypothetical protein